jgi:hypothetical protein
VLLTSEQTRRLSLFVQVYRISSLSLTHCNCIPRRVLSVCFTSHTNHNIMSNEGTPTKANDSFSLPGAHHEEEITAAFPSPTQQQQQQQHGALLGPTDLSDIDLHHLLTGDGCYDFHVAARTERKRSREKQRRSDVNTQFTRLTECLRVVELSCAATTATTTTAVHLPPYSPNNRVELLDRTVSLLNQLVQAQQQQVQLNQELREQLKQAQDALAAEKLKETTTTHVPHHHHNINNNNPNNMMMLVPMMQVSNSNETVAASNNRIPEPHMTPIAMMMVPHNGMMMAPHTTATPGMMVPQQAWMMPHPPPVTVHPAPTKTEPNKHPGSSKDAVAVGANLAHCA